METFSVSDDLMFRIHGAIEHQGFFTMSVMGTPTSPSWAYTIGLLEHDHPELVTIGLPSEVAHALLSRVYEDALAGVAFEPGRVHRRTWTSEAGVELDVAFLELPDLQWAPSRSLVRGVHAYYGSRGNYPSEPRVGQLVWPDATGRFPWEAGFDESQRLHQPLLDEELWDPHPDDDHGSCGPECDFWKG